MREDIVLNLQLKGMMEAYDMSNLFLVAGYPSLAKLHFKRFKYLCDLHTHTVQKLILRDNSVPNSGKVESMYPTPLTKDGAIALIPSAIKSWITWATEFLAELDKGKLYSVILKDLKAAKVWNSKFPPVDDSIPPMRQLMKAKLLETTK